MTKIASIFFCSLLVSMFVVAGHTIAFEGRTLTFEPAHQSLVVKVKKDKKDDDDDDDDDKPKKKKAFSCKKAKCDPGETKLDKPNIYGACCQVGAEPLKPKTTPAEPVKCKFPGEVPPDCNCPKGTEFMGYKGCLAPAKKGGSYCSEVVPESMVPLAKQTCTNNHPGGWLNCSIPKPGFVKCCCNWL